ncbi:ABC transporter substrate-binding protein [soil metagenome]
MIGRWLARAALVAAILASLLGAAAAVAQETGNRADRVRVAFPRDDGTLTPYTFELGYPLMTLVYDTLYWRGGGGGAEPWLARRLRKEEAGTRLEILLQRGARWHDGRPVTPADVEFSYEYFKSRYHPRFTPQLDPVVDAEVVDDRTVAINLEHATPGFEQVLADVPILPRHLWEGLVEGQTPDGPPIGSGPYRLVRHRVDESYRFRANRDYFRGEPRVDTIDVPFIRDFERTVRALRNDDVDMIPVTLPQDEEEGIRSSRVKVDTGTLYAGTALMFNTREPPFDAVRARQAVSSALDLSRITAATVGADPDSYQADRGYFHPESRFAAEGALHRFDESRARSELDQLGLPPIRVLAPDNDPVRAEAARQVSLALRRAGAIATSEEVSPGQLAAAVGQNGSSPDFQVAIWSTPPLASYNPNFLSVVFGSESQELSPLNYSGYTEPEFDRLAGLAERETNPAERSQLVRRQLDLLTRDAPVVPLFYPKGAFAYRPSIYDGWVYVAGTGILDKRSFLPQSAGSGEGSGASPLAGSRGSGGGIGALGIVALAMLAAVALFVGLGVIARVRAR